MKTNCKYHPYIDDYFDNILGGKKKACKDLKKELERIKKILDSEDIFIKKDKITRAKEIIEKYFKIKLLDWELFILGLIHCYKIKNGYEAVLFEEYLIMMGRGNGKNGFISCIAWYLTTKDHGIKGYNVDIVANSENQAKTSFEDVYNMLDNNWLKLKKFYKKTKLLITSIHTKSYIKFNTSNAKTKDGTRSACLIFDEIHEYENYDMIKVFKQSFGKRKHSRTFYITTQGYIRGGVIDEELDISKRVTYGEIEESRRVSLIYKLDDKNEVKDETNWVKACPSIEYMPDLKYEMQKTFNEMEYRHHTKIDFLTKRMNLVEDETYNKVASWDKILKTNRKVPYEDLKGVTCIATLDYATINDFASCGLLFKYKGNAVFIEHTFVCHKAIGLTARKIKFPIEKAVEKGLITIVKEDSITPDILANWYIKQRENYNIIGVAADDYRISLVKEEFSKYGLPIMVVRSGPITHSKIVPLIDNFFEQERIIWGDNMTMRWYANNTYKDIDAKGNYTYKKIEPILKKTDGFFGFIHGMSLYDKLYDYDPDYTPFDLGTISI